MGKSTKSSMKLGVKIFVSVLFLVAASIVISLIFISLQEKTEIQADISISSEVVQLGESVVLTVTYINNNPYDVVIRSGVMLPKDLTSGLLIDYTNQNWDYVKWQETWWESLRGYYNLVSNEKILLAGESCRYEATLFGIEPGDYSGDIRIDIYAAKAGKISIGPSSESKYLNLIVVP